MRCSLESYILAQALAGSEVLPAIIAKPDQWKRGGSELSDVRAAIEKLSSEPVMRATPSNLAQLRGGDVVFGPGGDVRDLAAEIMKAVDAGIESGANAKWRKKKYRAALKQASTRIAQETVKRIAADAEAGMAITRDQIRSTVASAVADVMQSVPSVFRKENMIGFGLFAIGLTLSGLVNVGLMSMTGETSLGTKLAIQGVIGTCMGYLLAIFNPYFNDKMSNQSRALNYKILNGMMAILGETKAERENAQAIDSSVIQTQLGEVYIAQQALDGRLQGVLGLMIGFCSFIGDSFYKARYILDDQNNPNRLQDACDLMAGIFVTSRLVFYAMKPEFKELFDAYIYSVLEPTLRKHSQEHGPEMFERIMRKIRDHKPAPSEETLKKFYEPFVRGALGLDQVAEDRDLLTEVKELLRTREAQA